MSGTPGRQMLAWNRLWLCGGVRCETSRLVAPPRPSAKTAIVDYIVRQTVGPLVEGRTPKQVEKLTVLDPACGSGSFLLGAYEFLLRWHLDFYVKHDPAAWAKKKNPPIYETAPNAHGLTPEEIALVEQASLLER